MKYAEYRHIFNGMLCQEAIDWLETQSDLQTAWENCVRGDWLWWALQQSDNTPKKDDSVAFAYFCAKNASAAYAAYVDSYAASTASAAYASAAYASAASAYASAAYASAAERLNQANWIREHIECPFK